MSKLKTKILGLVAIVKAKWVASRTYSKYLRIKLAIGLKKAERKAVKQAFKTGRKQYILRFGSRFFVGDRRFAKNKIQSINRITGKRFDWHNVVVAETS